MVEECFEYPQVDTFRWLAWFEVATGCVAIALQLLLFYNTDNCFQCGKKPEAPKEEDYKEVIKPSIKLADKLVSLNKLKLYIYTYTLCILDDVLEEPT